MKSQKHNDGDLKEIKLKIDKKIAEDLELMSNNTGIPQADLLVIALKRFRASHLDYLKQVPRVD